MKAPFASLIAKIPCALLCATALLLPSRVSSGAAFFMPVRGVRATSNAGAFIAGADDMWALWYNPANILDGSSLRASIDTSTVFFNSTFKHYESGVTADNLAGPMGVPSFGLSSNLGDPSLPTLAIGFTAPYAGRSRFGETSPARYALVDSSGTSLAFLHLAASYEVLPKLKIGVSLQNVITNIRQVSAASAYTGLFGTAQDTSLDMLSEVSASDLLSISANIGICWNPVPQSIIAFSAQMPYHVDAAGTMKFRIPSSYFFDGTTVSGDRADLQLRFPPVIRLAYRHRYKKLWAAEAALVYEAWSYHDEIRIIPQDIVLRDIPGMGDYELNDIVFPHDYQDSLSVRLGGSYYLDHVQPGLEARAGLSYESQAIPDERLDAALLDSHKVTLGLGASYTWQQFRFDAAYGYVFYAPRAIDQSSVYQINPTNPDGAVVIGNGTYRGQAHIIGLAVSYRME